MKKTLYVVKLNQNMKKYLTFANTTQRPALASQGNFELSVFFNSEEDAEKAIEAYLSHPFCKMTINNRKFILIEPIEAEYDNEIFPFTQVMQIVNNDKVYTLVSVYIEYNGFNGFGFICPNSYKNL